MSSGAFRSGAWGLPFDFDQGPKGITSMYQGSATGSYTVRGGETLGSIAANLWGDASMWWKLAEANGLSQHSALNAGQLLTIPAGVMRSTYNASTFTPYDPAKAMGETSPNPVQPKPPKQNKCGVIGQVMMVVIAAVVTVYTAGAAAGALGALANGAGLSGAFSGALAGGAAAFGGGLSAAATAGAVVAGGAGAGAALTAAGTALVGAIGGAAGSIVSQGVGVMTGIRKSSLGTQSVSRRLVERSVAAASWASAARNGALSSLAAWSAAPSRRASASPPACKASSHGLGLLLPAWERSYQPELVPSVSDPAAPTLLRTPPRARS